MLRTRILLVFLSLFLGTFPSLLAQQLKDVPSDALKRGMKAPELSFESVVQGPTSGRIEWKALRGRVVVLEFWGTWCPPCIAGIPHLNELVARYKGKPVQFIAVGHENQRKVEWFLKKKPIDSWVVSDTSLSMYKSYTAFGIPYAVIVDQNGVVAAVLNPRNVDEGVIDAVLAGKSPVYPALTADSYWNPVTAAEYFLKVGKEGPPVEK